MIAILFYSIDRYLGNYVSTSITKSYLLQKWCKCLSAEVDNNVKSSNTRSVPNGSIG